MKKSKLITGLSAAFISAIALFSCSQIIRPNGDVILTINGEAYTAEDLFNDQKTPAAAEAKYNAVYKAAVRNYFAKDSEGQKLMDEIKNETEIKMSGQKAKAQSDASKNGTSYDEEWQKILDNNNCSNESELYDKFEYDIQKEKFEDKLYDYQYTVEGGKKETNYDVLRRGGFLKDKEGKEHGYSKIAYYKTSTEADDKKTEISGQSGYSNVTVKLNEEINRYYIEYTYNGKTEIYKEKQEIKGYLSNKLPYHVKHILVKVGADANDNSTGTITAEQAKKLSNVILALAQGDSFDKVSQLYSDDDTAKGNHSSLGIMSTDTSFVDDFKLGTYLYEAYFSSSTSAANPTYEVKDSALKQLKLDDTTKGAGKYAELISQLSDPTTNSGIGQIPFEAALALGYDDYNYGAGAVKGKGLGDFEYKDTRLNSAGVAKDDFKEKYLPRNVIFNKYFNKHNIMVITPNTLPGYAAGSLSTYITIPGSGAGSTRTSTLDLAIGSYSSTLGEDATLLPGFCYTTSASNNDKLAKNKDTVTVTLTGNTDKRVLRDNNGRVVLVFRSGTEGDSGYQGIHFVVIERSPFIGKEFDTVDGSSESKPTTLEEYYTQYYPTQTGGSHPKYEGTDDWKKTFVHYIDDNDLQKYKNQSDSVKVELKKCVSNLDKYIYDYLLDKGGFEFNGSVGKEIEESIRNWIDTNRVSDEITTKETWDENWERYYYSLSAKTSVREEYVDGTEAKGTVIPGFCVTAITDESTISNDDLAHYFGVGGVFHD